MIWFITTGAVLCAVAAIVACVAVNGRLRGGFTYTHTNSAGQVVVQRVTTSRRR
jgi:hypothetical protein